MRRIPCCDFRQTLLAGSEAQEREAYGPNAHNAEFVICDQSIDITYIRLVGGWLYLVAFLDWHSRYIVSWELDQSLAEGLVLAALDRGLAQATPAICNSDQGSQFTSPQYLDRLKGAGVAVSMDGRGRALDNIFTERLWRTIKYEGAPVQGLNASEIVRSNLAS